MSGRTMIERRKKRSIEQAQRRNLWCVLAFFTIHLNWSRTWLCSFSNFLLYIFFLLVCVVCVVYVVVHSIHKWCWYTRLVLIQSVKPVNSWVHLRMYLVQSTINDVEFFSILRKCSTVLCTELHDVTHIITNNYTATLC